MEKKIGYNVKNWDSIEKNTGGYLMRNPNIRRKRI